MAKKRLEKPGAIPDVPAGMPSAAPTFGGPKTPAETEAWLRGILAAPLDPVVTIDLMGIMHSASDSCTRVFQWTPAELVGKNIKMLMPEPYHSEHDEYLANFRKTGKTNIIGQLREFEAVRKDGTRFPCEIAVSLAPIPGQPPMVVGIIRDITPRRAAQATLEASEARLRGLLQAPHDPVLTIDVFGIIHEASNAFQRVFQYQPHELVGKNIKMLMPEPYQSEHDEYLANYRRTGKTAIIGRVREFRALRKDGSEFPCEIAVSIAEIHHQPPMIVGIIRDITQRNQVEEELARLNKMLADRNVELENFAYNSEKLASMGKLAASVAHEIRNPLTAIKMHLYAMQQSLPERPDLEGDFRVVNDEMLRLESVVRNFLDYSRSPALKTQTLTIELMIDKVLELFGRRLTQKGIQLIREGDKGLPPVVADLEQMKQVFINLLTNAEEAMPQGGIIGIISSMQRDDQNRPMNVIRFHDNGPGVPESIRRRLFEPFFTTKEDGTGLGLGIARRIVEGHGGKLVLETTSIGTSFAIWLPPSEAKKE
ncbi:MAG TPA: PAS domain S-box protein [Planctomycetota bacterium]|nr:PAS domain S-box protein [Planctomycetota bacterium]